MKKETAVRLSDRLDSLSAYEMKQVMSHAINHECEISEIRPSTTHT